MINVNETMLKMAKALDPKSLKSYGAVLGIQGGSVYATNGFALLRWVDPPDIGDDRVLSATLTEVYDKQYPQCQAVIPKAADLRRLDARQFDDMLSVLKPTWRGVRMELEIAGEFGALVPSRYPRGNLRFNPMLLVKMAKGLPKTAECIEAGVTVDGVLLLTFKSVQGEFQIVLVSLKETK